MPEHFDLIILGGGSGGYVAAIRAAQLGLRTAVIEHEKVGGTCLHRGCIPTKALLQTASLLDSLRHSQKFGVHIGEVSFDFAVAAQRRDDVVQQLYKGVEFLLRKNGVTLFRGRGRFTSSTSVVVEGDKTAELQAAAVIIATGSRPKLIPGLEVDGRQVLTSDEALFLPQVPRSAIVLGAGAVGVEFASFYRSCGADVTVVEMESTLVPLEDEAVGEELQRQFEARGINCLTGTRLDPASLQRGDAGVTVNVDAGGGTRSLSAEVLLVAVGRTANVEEIGLENTKVVAQRGLIGVDENQKTSDPAISAVGDCTGGFQLAHKAMHEGVAAVEAIAGKSLHPVLPAMVPRTTYCTPQIASVGLSEREARAAGHEVSAGVFPFKANGRALIWGENGGFCKVVADSRSNSVLGVHLIGHEVTELIAGPALGALLEATPFELGRAIAPHPTLSEVLGEAALAVSGQAIHI